MGLNKRLHFTSGSLFLNQAWCRSVCICDHVHLWPETLVRPSVNKPGGLEREGPNLTAWVSRLWPLPSWGPCAAVASCVHVWISGENVGSWFGFPVAFPLPFFKKLNYTHEHFVFEDKNQDGLSYFIFLNFLPDALHSSQIGFLSVLQTCQAFLWFRAFAPTTASFWISFTHYLSIVAFLWTVTSQFNCYFLREAFPSHP